MKIEHILVDMDPTKEEQPALTKAMALAKHFGARLELFLVEYNGSLVANNFLNGEQLNRAKNGFLKSRLRWLESYAKQVRDAGIEVSIDARWHKPIYEGIIQKAKDSDADLVVKSTHVHPRINKIFFTPNDWQLLKSCPIPVLLTKINTSSVYDTIMAAVDPSQSHGKTEGLDKVILEVTTSLAKTLKAEAHVVHYYESIGAEVWQDLGVGVHGLDTQSAEYQTYLKGLKAHHEEQFDNLISNYDFAKNNRHLEPGVAHVLLPEIIEQYRVSLLVVGTTYRSGLMGSTAEKILDNVGCDILALKFDE